MANVLFGHRFWSDAGTFSGGDWVESLPLAHLQDRDMTAIARSADLATASTQFDVDLGATRPVRLAALVGHTLSQAARHRLRLATDAGFTNVLYDSGSVPVWRSAVSWGALPWGTFRWGQRLDEVEARAFGPYLVVVLPAGLLGRHLRWELDDQANADGHVDIARAVVSDAWQPTWNMVWGGAWQVLDPSTFVESRGGQRWWDVRPQRRRAELTLDDLTDVEADGLVLVMDRLLGRSGPLLFVRDPDDADSRSRHSIYGTLAELAPTVRTLLDRQSRRFVIEEEI